MKQLFLLLDDDPGSALSFAKILRSAHYDILMASSVKQARELLERGLPHALVVDIHLGGTTTGLDWLQSLTKSPFAGLPSLVLSSSSASHDVVRALELNVVDYIIKPSNSTLITQKIERLARTLSRSATYSCVPGPETLVPATLRVPGLLEGISDSRLSVEGPFLKAPQEGLACYRTPFFREASVSSPRLRLAFAETVSPRSHRNYFQIEGWSEEERRQLFRFLYQGRHRPKGWDSLIDVSSRRIPFHLEEDAELINVCESEIELGTRIFIESRSIAELVIGDLELPVVIRESAWRTNGAARVVARIDGRISDEAATGLRRLIVGLKRGSEPPTREVA